MFPRYGRNGQRRVESHEKSMGKYELHAWRDAMELAQLLQETLAAHSLDIDYAWQLYQRISPDDWSAYEDANAELIAAFLKKTPSQRPAQLRKWSGNRPQEVVSFLLIAVVCAVRAMKVMELRDYHRMALAPGGGYRATTASVYAFGSAVAQVYADYNWPYELFEAIGMFVLDPDEEEDEEDGEEDPVANDEPLRMDDDPEPPRSLN